MPKTIIHRILGSVLIFQVILGLSACASPHVSITDPACANMPHTDNATLNDMSRLYIDPTLTSLMGPRDHARLQNLVATAQAQEDTAWRSHDTGAQFEFASARIYVDPQGHGCRDYRLTYHRPLWGSRSFDYTACRDRQGAWKVVMRDTPPLLDLGDLPACGSTQQEM